MRIGPISTISFKEHARQLFSDNASYNFSTINSKDTFNNSNISYHHKSETSEIDYEVFIEKFKKSEGITFDRDYNALEKLINSSLIEIYSMPNKEVEHKIKHKTKDSTLTVLNSSYQKGNCIRFWNRLIDCKLDQLDKDKYLNL